MTSFCEFEMKVKGTRENIDLFLDAMQKKRTVYIGRGAELDDISYYDGYALTTGSCKQSIEDSLILKAVDMKTHPENWDFDVKNQNGNVIIRDDDKARVMIVTLGEACKMFDVTIEVFSCEPEYSFAEHYIVTPDEIRTSETCEYYEFAIANFAELSREEAEAQLGAPISDEDWEDPDDKRVSAGGFKRKYCI